MPTHKIVPRADNEGGIGTALKRWASAFINAITGNSATITAIRGAELAPAITEANWDTNVAGWVHPVVGGVLDHGSDGETVITTTTPVSISIGDVLEVTITVVNSPTTSTFVAGTLQSAIWIGNADWVGGKFTAVGTHTFIYKALTTDGLSIWGDSDSRFGISSVSIKKLTEGNLTMNGGQILAEADLVGGVPGYAFEGHPDTGLGFAHVSDCVEILLHGHILMQAYEGGIDFYDPADDKWILGIYPGEGIYTDTPTDGTANGWKLGSVVNNEIEVEVGGDAVLRKLLTTRGGTIASVRGTELAPAITEANWDAGGAGWVHPVVGGVLDKSGDGQTAAHATSTTPENNATYEIIYTVVNSPTTGTFVGGGSIYIGGVSQAISAIGTFTFCAHTANTDNLYFGGSTLSRFGISAISVKKLTEGNLTMNGGQILAEADLVGLPGYAFEGHTDTGMLFKDGHEMQFRINGFGALYLYPGGIDFYDPNDETWLGGFYKTDGIWDGTGPTDGTANGWKLGSVVNNEIEVEVGGDAVLRKLLTTRGGTIASVRGAELAPALTEANWDTNVAGWTHAVTGGILDKSGDGTGAAATLAGLGISIGDTIELIITIGNSPTTSTFLHGGTIALGGTESYFEATGAYTFIYKATTTDDTFWSWATQTTSRFGISAISVKKLTEGNLTIPEGQIFASHEVDYFRPGYSFKDFPGTGLFCYADNGGLGLVHDGKFAIDIYDTEVDFYDVTDGVVIGNFQRGLGVGTEAPTGGTAANWKLGSAVNNEIEVEVGGDAVLRKLLTTRGGTIASVRGTELAPALTEANWDTNVAGWTHAVTGGILDKSGDGTGTVWTITPVAVEAGCHYEVAFTVVVSPTTGTFVGNMRLDDGNSIYSVSAVGTYTYIFKATGNDADVASWPDNASRFGISAISVKKLTEGNLTMNGGQILAEADLVGGVPGYSFEGHTDTGYLITETGDAIQCWIDGVYTFAVWNRGGGDSGFEVMGGIYTSAPTGGTEDIWKLGSVVNNEIEVEVGGDAVLRKLLTTRGGTIASVRGAELAPALTEANWDTNVAGWVHPVVGGVLDKGSAGDYAQVTTVTPISVSIGDVLEVFITFVNSPTTGTFVATNGTIGVWIGNSLWKGLWADRIGTHTFTYKATSTDGINIAGADADRFGVSAISIKKITEGNLTMDGGQFLAKHSGTFPGYAFEGHEHTGISFTEETDDVAGFGFTIGEDLIGGVAVTGFSTLAPTGGTWNNLGWKLGSVVNNEIEVEVGGDTVKRMLLTAAGIAAIPEASDNATAATAGVAVGGLYHTNANPAVVCIRTA
jgi:hypothetical protein